MKQMIWMLSLAAVAICGTLKATEYSVTFCGIKLSAGERIVGFDIKTKSAYFSSLRRMPLGWNISIDNQPSWATNATGSILVGAAAVDMASLNRLFHVVPENSLKDVEISGEIVTSADFEHEHRIVLKPADVRLVADPSTTGAK